MAHAVSLLAITALISVVFLPASAGTTATDSTVSPLFLPDWMAESNLGAAAFGAAVA